MSAGNGECWRPMSASETAEKVWKLFRPHTLFFTAGTAFSFCREPQLSREFQLHTSLSENIRFMCIQCLTLCSVSWLTCESRAHVRMSAHRKLKGANITFTPLMYHSCTHRALHEHQRRPYTAAPEPLTPTLREPEVIPALCSSEHRTTEDSCTLFKQHCLSTASVIPKTQIWSLICRCFFIDGVFHEVHLSLHS